MTIFVCKTCGRSLKAEEKPNFCYFDRTTAIENISDEDAVKMGLFSTTSGAVLNRPYASTVKLVQLTVLIFEFFGDVKYDPFTGEKVEIALLSYPTLVKFQENIMRKVTE